MATYGTGNLVGTAYDDTPPSVKRYAPTAALGGVAAWNLKRAVAPNVAGQIAASAKHITDLDAKIDLEHRYKKPNPAVLQDLHLQRARAVSNHAWVKGNVAALHTPIKRVKRAGIGLAALAGAAALFPRKKQPDATLG